jgi:nucleotide-binding universal stress UspA family protein
MIRSILVPTDFSANAMKAALYAASLAQKSGAMVYLLHVTEPVTDSIRQPYPLHDRLVEEITNNRIKEMKKFQSDVAVACPDIKTETEIAKGMTITSIHDFAKGQQIDLIVMGTKGATGLKEIFMGSVAAGTISRSEIPVLAVPDEYVFEVPDGILFATNRFEKKKELLNKIVEIANMFSTCIHVAVFVDTDTAEATDYIYNTRQLVHYLAFLKMAYPGVAFKAELLEGSEFEETIEKYDAKNEVDIIAMITYPKSFWERLMKKSMTKKMAFNSKIPVLAIPAK